MSHIPIKASRLVLALVASGVLGGVTVEAFNARAIAAPAAVVAPAAAPVPTVGVPDFTVITREQGPAVVNISVTGMRRASAQDDSEASDDPLELFRRFGAPQRDMPTRGTGSGFIVSEDGLILTNAHVVKGASEVTVKLTDRREFRAKVLGSDEKTDVAVLKINAGKLPTVRLGKTQDLAVGEWVLAIGSPFGLENSVSAGVVSAKGRSLPSDSSVPFIQTDVAVNPGNSGGPLFNARGEVVGINSQIYSRTGGYQGLSFAIPIEVASRVKDQIAATGKVSHARLGVAVQEVNQALADSFGLPTPQGALVARVEPASPADKAGLKAGDVIRKAAGQPVVASGDLPAIISQSAPGVSVALEVWRNGKEVQLSAKLAGASDRDVASADAATSPAAGGRLGLALSPLAGGKGRGAGLLVEDVSGAAERAGVAAGDVLLSVNGVPASSIDVVRSALDKSGKSVALLIERDGQRLFVAVPLALG
ncbi:MAG TPA: Do family serine endopeptidase [Ramlibacter sp.]|nr:Do family serine endopeptidase [Ramlibacter sp.]